jgi:Protein of unknown function (DUF3306)
MTLPENFVSRWARRKREVACLRRTETEVDAPQPATTIVPDTDTAPRQHENDRTADEAALDQASLPSIETITFDTDIRAFLRSRVPAELTRAALRRAWASDPAIRDFIGIAENQWDFNDPNAIPGFGPLLESDNLPDLLAQAIGNGDRLAETVVELPLSEGQSLSAAIGREPNGPDRTAQRTPGGPAAVDPDIGPPIDGPGEGAAIGRVAERSDAAPDRRPHGSALPRFED